MVAPMAKSPVPKKKPAAKRISPAERERVEILFRRFESLDLHPKTELNYSNPYELVTAVALSAQATDVQVNKATGPLFQVADSAEKIPIVHHWLILHGRYVCTARNPKCTECGISDICRHYQKQKTKNNL